MGTFALIALFWVGDDPRAIIAAQYVSEYACTEAQPHQEAILLRNGFDLILTDCESVPYVEKVESWMFN